ncbi:hypothetical protein GCM10010399_63660 [Dactylosporangium fulvum]
MTGFSWEDSCTCTDPFASSPPAFEEACPAHGSEARDVAQRLGRWRIELVGAAPAVLTDVHLRLYTSIEALEELLGGHWRHEAPGPTPSPTGTCGSCGGTGEVFHGFGEDGPIFAGECGCETPYCGGCGGAWPCLPVVTVGRAVGARFALEATS